MTIAKKRFSDKQCDSTHTVHAQLLPSLVLNMASFRCLDVCPAADGVLRP